MATYRITAPDGGTYEVTAPDTASQDEVMSYAQQNYKTTASPKPETSVLQDAGNLAAGAVRGAGSIGSTILAPFKAAWDGSGQSGAQTERGRLVAGIDEGLQRMGADPNSGMYAAGKLGAEIAGTVGAGGVIGKALTEAAPLIPSLAPYIPKVATALETGGFRLNPASMVGPMQKATLASRSGDLAIRTGAGATVGGTAAGMIDPEQASAGAMIGGAIPGGVKAAGAVGGFARDMIGKGVTNTVGLMSGAGGEALKTAYKAGKSGAQAFVDNMRGKIPMTDILDDAKAALSRMRIAKGEAYRKGMADISADKSVLDFTPIQNAVAKVQSIGSFKGQAINKNAAGTVDDIANEVSKWSKLDPADFHTPEGLDALKQSIGDIRDATQFGTPARRVADTIYHAVKDQITKQAPTYAKTMKGYSDASDLVSEIQKALSLGDKASADTTMRKLQSLMRNNVNTNYGNRLNLARELEQQGGAELMPSIAGQALSSATPRGLQGLGATGTGVAGLFNPLAWGMLPLQSPRLMGEAFYGAGRLRDLVSQGADKVIQNPALTGRLSMLAKPNNYQSLMTVAPSVAMSR